MENHGKTMLSQFPALSRTVAAQMEAYRERMAQRIRQQATEHGERPADLAHALDIHPSTVERWFRGERTPQPRLRKRLVEHWEIEPSILEIDLEAEERKVQVQLDRIETYLRRLLAALGLDPDAAPEDVAVQAAEEALQATRRARRGSARRQAAS